MKKLLSFFGLFVLCTLWAAPAFSYSTYSVKGKVKSGGSWHTSTSISRDGDCGTNCKMYDVGLSAYCDDVDGVFVEQHTPDGYYGQLAHYSVNGSNWYPGSDSDYHWDSGDGEYHWEVKNDPDFANDDMCGEVPFFKLYYLYTSGGTLYSRKYHL